MSVEHTAQRPGWTCGGCGQEWPCGPARDQLCREYGANRVNLAVYMATQLGHAAGDLPRDTATPASLYRRFIAWTR